MHPKVSVVVPIYNTERYLDRCITSVLAQSERAIEVICVDDGSLDQSGRICEEYARQDPRVRVIHQRNAGVSVARNTGLSAATGRYVCFVDSDDFVHRAYIATLLSNLENSGSCMAVFGLSKDTIGDEIPENRQRILPVGDALADLFREKKGIRGYIGGKLFQSEMIKQGVRFDESQKLAEDLLFVFDYLTACGEKDTVCVTAAPLYCYVTNENSALERRTRERVFDFAWCGIVDAYDKLLAKVNSTDLQLRKAIALEKVMQCVTLLRIMIRCNATKAKEYRQYKRFVLQNIFPYVCSRDFSFRKRIGAVLILLYPKI